MNLNKKTCDSPCHACTDRSAECHSTCERYKEYSKRIEKIREEKRIISEQSDYYAAKYRQCATKSALYKKRNAGKRGRRV